MHRVLFAAGLAGTAGLALAASAQLLADLARRDPVTRELRELERRSDVMEPRHRAALEGVRRRAAWRRVVLTGLAVGGTVSALLLVASARGGG